VLALWREDQARDTRRAINLLVSEMPKTIVSNGLILTRFQPSRIAHSHSHPVSTGWELARKLRRTVLTVSLKLCRMKGDR
jgi:hypothetical protein